MGSLSRILTKLIIYLDLLCPRMIPGGTQLQGLVLFREAPHIDNHFSIHGPLNPFKKHCGFGFQGGQGIEDHVVAIQAAGFKPEGFE